MPLFAKKESEKPSGRHNIAAEHNLRAGIFRAAQETPTRRRGKPQPVNPTPEPAPGPEVLSDPGLASQPKTEPGKGRPADASQRTRRFKEILDAAKKSGLSILPRKYRLRTAMWDLASFISLFIIAILLGVVLVMAFRINTLQNTLQDTLKSSLNGVLGGLYNNFVRMDKSFITTTITVEDMPIPLDFNLPVVQNETNVTLTQDVTIHGAYVIINTGTLNINAPATVTLPAGTTLPVSLQMDVPVKTTVYMDLQVPINIELAKANSTDPAIANMHTAFLGLQDTIGPLYCLVQPAAIDYLSQPLCNLEGKYVNRTPPTP